jgi:CRISPR/Cas system type I-B associated protein Csh2 (Cas7 group RAMP superfamily)
MYPGSLFFGFSCSSNSRIRSHCLLRDPLMGLAFLWEAFHTHVNKSGTSVQDSCTCMLTVGTCSSNVKKQKPAPSNAIEIEERVGLVLPYLLDASINQVTPWITGVTQADIKVIKNLETKLRAPYEYELSQYKEEIATLQVHSATAKANSNDIGHLKLQDPFL